MSDPIKEALIDLTMSAAMLLRQFRKDRLIAGDWENLQEFVDQARVILKGEDSE